MFKEIKYLFFVIVIFFFIFFTVRFYFSDENLKKSYRSISQLDEKIKESEKDLIMLNNNTDNIIEFVEIAGSSPTRYEIKFTPKNSSLSKSMEKGTFIIKPTSVKFDFTTKKKRGVMIRSGVSKKSKKQTSPFLFRSKE